jgi:hypothetical protein
MQLVSAAAANQSPICPIECDLRYPRSLSNDCDLGAIMAALNDVVTFLTKDDVITGEKRVVESGIEMPIYMPYI